MKRIRVYSAILALVLGMTAIFAFPKFTEAASKSVTMYVITSDSYYNYTYYSNGLIKSSKKSDSDLKYKFTYDSKNRVKTQTAMSDKSSKVYVYCVYYYSKGRITKSIADTDNKANNFKESFSFNDVGQLKKVVKKFNNGYTYINRFTYDKNGHISAKTHSSVYEGGKSTSKVKKIKYDNGLVTSYEPYNDRYRVKYTYKNGRLTKSVTQEYYENALVDEKYYYHDWGNIRINKYKYKKVQVPSSLVAKVKSQQKELLVPYEIGVYLDSAGTAIAVATSLA